jgi:hypothetical protein
MSSSYTFIHQCGISEHYLVTLTYWSLGLNNKQEGAACALVDCAF